MEQPAEVAAANTNQQADSISGVFKKLIQRSQVITLLLILIGLCVFLSLHTKTFFSSTNIFNIPGQYSSFPESR